MSRKNANFSLRRRAREGPVVVRSDVVASPAPRPKSWTWIVKRRQAVETAEWRWAVRGKSNDGGESNPTGRSNSREVRSTRRRNAVGDGDAAG